MIVYVIWASIDELLTYGFPQSDTSLACRGTHHIFNYTLDDDFIFLFGEVPFIWSLVAYGSPFFLSISKITNRINDDYETNRIQLGSFVMNKTYPARAFMVLEMLVQLVMVYSVTDPLCLAVLKSSTTSSFNLWHYQPSSSSYSHSFDYHTCYTYDYLL